MSRKTIARLPIGPAKPRIPSLMMRVWDAPTRLFHWVLALLIGFSWLSNERSWIELHFLSGYAVLALLLFRLVWGVVGSDTARFSRFMRSPVLAVRYLLRFGRREPDTQIGHNPAGGWMVLAMLVVLLAQVGTGLFSNDDIASQGPLAYHVDKAVSDAATSLHGTIFNVMLGLMALHVLVVIAYAVVKRHDLVRPMITGRKRLPATLQQPHFSNPLLALAVLLGCAGAVWLLITFG